MFGARESLNRLWDSAVGAEAAEHPTFGARDSLNRLWQEAETPDKAMPAPLQTVISGTPIEELAALVAADGAPRAVPPAPQAVGLQLSAADTTVSQPVNEKGFDVGERAASEVHPVVGEQGRRETLDPLQKGAQLATSALQPPRSKRLTDNVIDLGLCAGVMVGLTGILVSCLWRLFL